MPGQIIEYNETTDLYMEMLRDAQKMEDQKLISIIRNRIKRKIPHKSTKETLGNIIPLPMSYATEICIDSEDEFQFWKNQIFWEDLIQFFAVFGTLVAWFLFFVYLLSKYNGIGY